MAKSSSVSRLAPRSGTREAILEVARRLFVERGYDATSLRVIAETVGTTKAAVYYHFPAKENLLLELTRPMLDAMADLVTRLRNSNATSDANEVLEAYLDLFLDYLPVLGVLASDPATHGHPDIGMRARLLIDSIQQHLAGTEPTPERVTRAACAVGVIHSVATLPAEFATAHRGIVLDAAIAALNPSTPKRQRNGTRQPKD